MREIIGQIKAKTFLKKTEKTFAKPLDILPQIVYNINVALSDMREWRNWQTRTFEGRVVHTVRVQVPFLAPKRLQVN